jgi:phosphopentomutase
MKRFVLVVLDGFGIGAMDDVPVLRPRDKGANTCLHIFEAVSDLKLPTLSSLGLGNAVLAANPNIGTLPETLAPVQSCCYGVHCLAHFGADTFWGHQELMGTKPLKGESAPILPKLTMIQKALEAEGHKVRFYQAEGSGDAGILIIDEAVTIGDNLETDLGDNYNVTAALDIIPFEEVKKIGILVRSLVHSSRVIVFGGLGVGLQNLLDAFEGRQGYAGVNAPRSGVYRRGYQVLHLGYGVNAEVQVPAVLAGAGIPVMLIGKAADIIENPGAEKGLGRSIPGVDTEEVLDETAHILDTLEQGFICVNVQETDLAGHREDPRLYAEKLVLADRGIKQIMDKLGNDDIMVVTADHGNDPVIGHPQHTREKTPGLVWGTCLASPCALGIRSTLADTGATAADFFNAPAPESGHSYLKLRSNN